MGKVLKLFLALALFASYCNIATTSTTGSLQGFPGSTGTIAGLPSVPTFVPSSNGTVSGICIYTITGDMYGLGVRLGFYLQSATGIIATIFIADEGEQGRANSAILSFALLVAFSVDVQDNALSLELQIFMALITIVSLPLLSLIAVQQLSYQKSFKDQRSFVALSLVYLTSCCLSLWGIRNGWYTDVGLCPVLSGLGGSSAISRSGRIVWTTLLSLETTLACILLSLGIFKLLSTSYRARRYLTKPWIKAEPRRCGVWLAFAMGVWVVCVASTELVIERHHIGTPDLTSRDLGQWMSLCAGIGAALNLISTLLLS